MGIAGRYAEGGGEMRIRWKQEGPQKYRAISKYVFARVWFLWELDRWTYHVFKRGSLLVVYGKCFDKRDAMRECKRTIQQWARMEGKR